MAGSQRSSAGDLALVAGFAALVAVCSVLPAFLVVAGVPVTLQTFAVLLAGLVLGAGRGLLAVLLWLIVGLTGMPVFALGTGGLGVLAGPTVGYLLSFPLAAALAGLIGHRAARLGAARTALVMMIVGALAGTAVIHAGGIAGLMVRLDLGLVAAAVADAAFVPLDIVKAVLAAIVAAGVHRAFPDLRRSAPAREPAHT